jgi:cell wall-associated NlpC family hydrolase
MESRVMGNYHARFGVGENPEITSKDYLSLFWGGASPSTSFDCSGFVCWVINNCGNGWNVGRTTADGLRSYCSYVSPSDAKPGDLIFFQGTYDTPGASHVGIYVGNNMMIHCGNPIQYTSIASSYWQQHFMAFGRLH